MPRSAFASSRDELCAALQGVISYLVMRMQRAEARATSTAIELDQSIWTLLRSHTQVRHKNTFTELHVCVLMLNWLGKKWKELPFLWSDLLFGRATACCSELVPQNWTFCGNLHGVICLASTFTMMVTKVGATHPSRACKHSSYKELFKNNPQAKIWTILLCTNRFTSISLTSWQPLCAHSHETDVQNKQVPPSLWHFWTHFFKGWYLNLSNGWQI